MMIAGLALMGFAELFIDPVRDGANYPPQPARRHGRTNRYLYAGDRRGHR